MLVLSPWWQGKASPCFFPPYIQLQGWHLENVNTPCAYGVSQRSWLFIEQGKPFMSDAKGEANFSLGMQSQLLPTHLPEVRTHLRTCFWCWSLQAQECPYSLCSSYRRLCVASCPHFWPQSLDTRCTIWSNVLVVSGGIKHNHREVREPSPPRLGAYSSLSHTWWLCYYILYFQLVLFVVG